MSKSPRNFCWENSANAFLLLRKGFCSARIFQNPSPSGSTTERERWDFPLCFWLRWPFGALSKTACSSGGFRGQILNKRLTAQRCRFPLWQILCNSRSWIRNFSNRASLVRWWGPVCRERFRWRNWRKRATGRKVFFRGYDFFVKEVLQFEVCNP